MKPLDGIRVLDLSHVLAMPYCTMILGDLGAEVIKVERPGTGDDSRSFAPFVKGESAYFMSVNRNKRSVVLDLRTAGGKQALRDLIRVSHVITENYKPGTMDKLGFSCETIKSINPRIIYASISGFGHDSVYPARPGYDIIAQAFGGFMSITGYPETPPTRAGASIADIVSGLFTTIGIMGALRTAEATGKGQQLDIAMVDCVLAVLENAVVRYTSAGETPQRIGSRHPVITPFDVFRSADGNVVIAAGNDRLWEQLCRTVPELTPLLDDERFATNESRTAHHTEVKQHIESWSTSLDTEALIDAVANKAGVPCGPVNSVRDIVEDANTRHRNMLVEFEHPVAGDVKTAGNPIRLSETPCSQHRRAPLLGEDTEDVLSGLLGYSPEEVDRLREEKAFG